MVCNISQIYLTTEPFLGSTQNNILFFYSEHEKCCPSRIFGCLDAPWAGLSGSVIVSLGPGSGPCRKLVLSKHKEGKYFPVASSKKME